jgi:hypothetical protein
MCIGQGPSRNSQRWTANFTLWPSPLAHRMGPQVLVTGRVRAGKRFGGTIALLHNVLLAYIRLAGGTPY